MLTNAAIAATNTPLSKTRDTDTGARRRGEAWEVRRRQSPSLRQTSGAAIRTNNGVKRMELRAANRLTTSRSRSRGRTWSEDKLSAANVLSTSIRKGQYSA